MDRNYDCLVKVLLCGDSGVGKTCLISQFTDGQVRKSHITTIGIDFKLKTLNVDGKRLRMQIWDTAGQERFETLTAQYYRRAQGIMLVYDVTKERTFTNVSKWLRNIEENAVDNVRIVLVGNKIDLENQREVSEKRGKKVQLADQHGVQFFETSAWANRHVTQPFDSLASQIMEDMTQKVQVERNGTIKLGYGQSINDVRPA
ncbi:Ras-related protein RABE1c, partial [Geodia barretti]